MNLTSFFKTSLCVAVLLSLTITVSAQRPEKYTPYDELPSIEKILKPEYSDNMPDWGKMLYQYPVNFNEISRAYTIWEKQNPGVKNALSRYYKLWRINLASYVDYDGTIHIPDPKVIEANLIKSQSHDAQLRKAPAAGNTSNWTFLGPKETFWLNESGSSTPPKACPWQVNVYSMDVAENFPDVVYVGTETGFVNKTTDKGKTWELCGLKYAFGGGVTAVAINHRNTDTVYVSAGNTVHRSYDGGKKWSRSANGAFSANRLKIDPRNPSKIVASTNKGIWISSNNASSWVQKTSTECWDVELKPGSPDTIYAITKSASNFFRIIQSNDGGNTFDEIASFPTEIPQVSGGLIATTPKNPNILFAVMLSRNSSGSEVPFLYKGTFAGGQWTWALKYTGYTGLSSGSGMTNGQGFFDLVLDVSPVNENIVYMGTTSFYKSINGGGSFTAIGGYQGNFSIHPDIQDMKMLSNGDTWVMTDGGVNLTTNNFLNSVNHFALNNNLIGSAMWGFDQGWNEDVIVGGRYHNGNTAITDFYGDKALRMGGGESPTGWVIQGKSRHVVFDDLGDGWILPKTAEGKPEGRFVFSKFPNMDEYGALRSNVVTHPYYSGQLYVGSENSIWMSTDFGKSFDLLFTFNGRVRYLNISTSNPNVMYADIVNFGFMRSEDGGVTWKKPANTNAPAWNGKIAFAISPYNENVVYASMQVGSWDSYNSEMYRTTNGGASWSQYSSLGRSIKSIVIQPTKEGKDLVYAFTASINGIGSTVYYRKDGDASWTLYDTNFPSGKRPVTAVAFFRDSKLRVAGNGGVWESPLAEPEFTPIVVPWADKKVYTCTLDTVQLDCHSWLNHTGAKWNWEISPAPKYISNAGTRNPKVVFNDPGKYNVTLKITQNDTEYSKTVADMFEIKTCPSIDDCTNPAELPKNLMKLVYADSYQAGNEPAKAFDGNPATIWHTAWSPTQPVHPHEIQIDLGDDYYVSNMIYVPRTDGANGRIKKYELYISMDKTNWGTPVKSDSLTNTSAPTTIKFAQKAGRYARLVALSEVNAGAWTSAAELTFTGCRIVADNKKIELNADIKAFPVPANAQITITLPFNNGVNTYKYAVYTTDGKQIFTGNAEANEHELKFDISKYERGYYFVNLTDSNGIVYRARFLKQ